VNGALARIAAVARRDFFYTVRRRAFLFTLFGTPLLYAILLFVVIKPQETERIDVLRKFKTLAVVDSSGLFAGAPRSITTEPPLALSPFMEHEVGGAHPRTTYTTEVRSYPDFASAERAMRHGEATQVLVIPPHYPATGALRRYARSSNLFASPDEGVVSRWLVRGLLSSRVDSTLIERSSRPLDDEVLYALASNGRYESKDPAREMLDFLLPFALGMLLGLSIVIGGQYLLQGVNEEKESRILESLLCVVTPEELLAGKLVGLGGAGLLLIGGWLVLAGTAAAPALGMLRVTLPAGVTAIMLVYFLLGYLFYGSLMTGVGAIASNMREAQQFSVWFTMLTFIPFYLLPTLIGHPGSPLAIALSLFPPTAPVATMLQLAAPNATVPPWQIALSILLLAGAALGVLLLSARLFRVGMLMYGKTPNLPEIMRWLGRA